jgi:hypothetical protein
VKRLVVAAVIAVALVASACGADDQPAVSSLRSGAGAELPDILTDGAALVVVRWTSDEHLAGRSRITVSDGGSELRAHGVCKGSGEMHVHFDGGASGSRGWGGVRCTGTFGFAINLVRSQVPGPQTFEVWVTTHDGVEAWRAALLQPDMRRLGNPLS